MELQSWMLPLVTFAHIYCHYILLAPLRLLTQHYTPTSPGEINDLKKIWQVIIGWIRRLCHVAQHQCTNVIMKL